MLTLLQWAVMAIIMAIFCAVFTHFAGPIGIPLAIIATILVENGGNNA